MHASWSRRLMAAGILAAWVALTGCGEAPEGNGKRGELFMVSSGDKVAGLPIELHVVELFPMRKDDSEESHLERWDFEDTHLEVTAPPGLDFTVQYRSPEDGYNRFTDTGYTLTARCDAVPDVPHEIQLRVLKRDGSVRYEDAFDIVCLEPTGMTVFVLDPAAHAYRAPSGQRFVVGSNAHWATGPRPQ